MKETDTSAQGAGRRPESLGARAICLSDQEIGQIRGVGGALKDLLKRAARALDVSLAVLELPGKELTVRVDSDERSLPNAGRVVSDLKSRLAQRDRDAPASEDIVFEPSGCGARHARVIASRSGQFEGCVFFARGEGGEPFSPEELALMGAVAVNIRDIVAARFDALTGLINQREFDYLLDASIAGHAERATTHSLLHVNLDRLADIRHAFGREAADAAVCAAAATLRTALEAPAAIAHLGQDEFGVLLYDCPTDRAWALGQNVRRAIRDMSIVHEHPVKLTASIGVASLSGSETVASALAAARIACVVAKERGRDRVALYQHRHATLLHSDAAMRVAKNLQQALRDDGFVLYCQPIEPLNPANEARSFEILLRAVGPDGERIEPGDFLPHAEHNRLMPSIDRWVIRHGLEALAEVSRHIDAGLCHFAMNLSGQSLCDDGLLDFIRNELARTRVPPGLVCFEVTETAAILNIDEAIDLMTRLRAVGCRFSLDDFGSGLSSFSYLKRLPIDYLKIDGQFVREIVQDRVSNAMVAAINQMSHALGLQTIAEFVENQAIRTQLAGIGVDYGQGYGIAVPAPLEDALERLVKVRHIGRSRRGA